MKIQRLTVENRPRVYAMLRLAFPRTEFQAELVEELHGNGRPLHEWVCLHANRIIAYLVFSNAYAGDSTVCGLRVGPMAVTPAFQRQGVGSELLRFALRQEGIKSQPLFVDGKPDYFGRFGFESGGLPISPYDKVNARILSMRHDSEARFVVGYEPEFTPAPPPSPRGKKGRPR